MSKVKVEGNWVKCGECNAKLFKVVEVYDRKPSCCIEIKCKAKHNGKTCNAMNYGLL